jgi:hypothetical protein
MSHKHRKPVKSLKTFTDKLIDYAGLFPPASLSLAQAFHNYLFYLQGEYKWMLNKFVIPAKRLGELANLMSEMKINGKISFSILGTGGETVNDFYKNLSDDFSRIIEFKCNNFEQISIEIFEVRLPREALEKEDDYDLYDLLINISTQLEKSIGNNIPIFYEAPMTNNHKSTVFRIVESIAGLDKGCGFKLRTGGTQPIAFPKPDQIAFAIMTCCELKVPMKFTAGLHHPIRHYDEGVSSYMHGFFNVFGAGILAYTNNFDETELLDVLNDEEPYEFIFKDEGFEWNQIQVSNSQIMEARREFMISYGSCSFEEPIEDLKIMELL